MDPRDERALHLTRRSFLNAGGTGIGLAALWTLLGGHDVLAAQSGTQATGGLPGLPHFAPKAKRVIYLFMPGAPSHIDLYDYKPKLKGLAGTDLPDSVRGGQRLTGQSASQVSLPIIPSPWEFKQHGQSGAWLSALVPNIAKCADDICFIKTLNNDQINHDPALSILLTGFQLAGRPTLGAWVSYALGSENQNLPAFVSMVSFGSSRVGGVPGHERMWGSGFLPPRYSGVKFGSGKDPVLYLSDPDGLVENNRRQLLDHLVRINQASLNEFGDPEIATRISQYEMAAKMQTSVPELVDLSKEPASTFELYGEDSKKPGTFARNCLLARRMAERGVRFIQVLHRGWDMHQDLPPLLPKQTRDVDQATAALVLDLKQRGMLDDTLILWGGEFGRTVYGQLTLAGSTATAMSYGRDHHVRCYTVWMAGGGIKPGISYGETDDFSYNVVKDPVHINDWHATILNRLGIDHTKLTYRFMGRDFRLTDTSGIVVKGVLA